MITVSTADEGWCAMSKKSREHPLTHRCANRKQGFGIRYLSHYNCSGWCLMQHEWDWDWDAHIYLPVVEVNYCPFCDERLVEE